MRPRIITPLTVVADDEGAQALRAEDASGSFGILARHADFLTSLALSVVGWGSGDGQSHSCAVRYGVLSVAGRRDDRDARSGRLRCDARRDGSGRLPRGTAPILASAGDDGNPRANRCATRRSPQFNFPCCDNLKLAKAAALPIPHPFFLVRDVTGVTADGARRR